MSQKTDERLYFVALVPPENIFREVEEIKKDLSTKYNTKASLRSPPHITLHMPFKFSEGREQAIFDALEKVKMIGPLDLELKDFGSFPPRVLYIRVRPTEALRLLHDRVTETLKKNLHVMKDTPRDKGFTPHMTVAFRDLRPAMFKEAWSVLQSRDIEYRWKAFSFFLLKHNGSNWDIFKEFPFL